MLRGLVQAGSLCTLCIYEYLFEHVYLYIFIYMCALTYTHFCRLYDRNELSQQNMFKQTVTVSRQDFQNWILYTKVCHNVNSFLLFGLNISHLYRPGRFLGTKSEGLWTDGASGILGYEGRLESWDWRWVTVAFPTATTATKRVFRIATTNNTELGYMIVSFDAAI